MVRGNRLHLKVNFSSDKNDVFFLHSKREMWRNSGGITFKGTSAPPGCYVEGKVSIQKMMPQRLTRITQLRTKFMTEGVGKRGNQTDTSKLFIAISELDKYGIKLKNFPSIVVTGPQSSGKSSVLEAICGKSILPKKMGMATLKPIHLTTIRDQHQRKFQISDRDIHSEKDALDELERLNANPSITKINVRIHAPDVYNSFLVDLPGLFYVTDEKTADLPKQVKKMNVEYISDANNIPVVVLAAPTDPATNQALQLVNKHSRSKDAFGIITKVDLTRNQSNDLLLDMLHGKKYPLGYGYVAVVLRNTDEIDRHVSIEEKIKDEAMFFERHPHFPHSLCGTMQMRRKISTIQLDRIKSALPELLTNIDREIESLKTSSSFLTNLLMEGNNVLSMRLKLLIEKLVGSSLERAEFEAELKNEFIDAIFHHIGNRYINNNNNNETDSANNNNGEKKGKEKEKKGGVDTSFPVDPHLDRFHAQFKTDISKINDDTFKELFSYGLISPLLINTETLDLACTEESLLGCSLPLFKFKIDDPMGKKRLNWNNYLRRYFTSLLKDNQILDVVYTITEKKILGYIFKDSEVDELTRKFAEYIVKEIGSEAYESKIKFSIQSMIYTEQRPQVSLIEIVRYLAMMHPGHFNFTTSMFSKKNHRIVVDVYGDEWNRAYLMAVANQLANNIYRNVSVNLLDRMVERLLEMTIDMFNKDMTEKEKEKINEKLNKLKEIRSIITSFHSDSYSDAHY